MELPLRGEPVSSGPFQGPRYLERALVVVRFSPVLRISDESGSGIASFQEAVRQEYPLIELEYEKLMRLEVRTDGTFGSDEEKHPVWRLFDIDKKWRVSLTPRSIAVEVDAATYTTWSDFAVRVSKLVAAAGEHFAPTHRQYIGVRYLNAAPATGDADPRTDCVADLVSITGNSDLEAADLLWRFRVDEGLLILRSGVMPPKNTYDPNMFKPRDEATWYLDIDVANNNTTEFDSERINSSILAQVKRLHAVYCWAMQGKASKGV